MAQHVCSFALLCASTFVLGLALAGCSKAPGGALGFRNPPKNGVTVTGPVSRKTCKKDRRTPAAIYNGRTYYFCCKGCRVKFNKDPAKYITRK